MLKDLDGAVGGFVTPLDGSGRPIGEDVRLRMLEPGWEFPVGDPAATSYLIRIVR